ncbi:MAG: hypothetical protein JXQ90_20080 [Cyclobacteriaceae bacterium]
MPFGEGSGKSKDTPSLFGKKKKVKEESKNEPILKQRAEPFTEEALINAWKQFIEKKSSENIDDMQQLILGRDISLGEDNKAVILLNSGLEVNIVGRLEQELIAFLRDSLQNDSINLEKEVREEEVKQRLYTSQDKYDYMLEQNPKLAQLKDRLGLDFQY